MLHAAIRTVTDQPVAQVINTGGQDHRWLGNGYWQAQGATVIASEAAIADHRARADDHMIALSQFLGEGLSGTEPAYADVTFEADYTLEFGGLTFEIMHRGAAHKPGDSFVWLDQRDVMFTGDIVYVERLLGNGPAHDTDSWIAVFEAMAAFDPVHIMPGHGGATDLATAMSDTYDYLMNLRTQIGALIEVLAGRNAQATYEEMERE